MFKIKQNYLFPCCRYHYEFGRIDKAHLAAKELERLEKPIGLLEPTGKGHFGCHVLGRSID